MYNITEFHSNPQHKIADITIGIIYLSCFTLGVPANILSVLYFTRHRFKKRDLPTYLYFLTALQDAIISFLSLNHGMTMVRYRVVWMPKACAAHHILYQMSQRMSVFLVATLSVTRTYILVYPLKWISPKTVLKVLAVLWILMTCFFVLPPSLGLVQITYHWEGGYCWATPVPNNNLSKTWDTLDNIMDTAGLAFPVLPITLSCVISAYRIMAERQIKSRTSNTSIKMRRSSRKIELTNRKATCTIIIVTMIYIATNIPLFVNYVLYLITILSFSYPGPIYSSPLMYFYSWNAVAILATALNALTNPIVYVTRFKSYRVWMKNKVLCRPIPTRRQSFVSTSYAEERSHVVREEVRLLQRVDTKKCIVETVGSVNGMDSCS